MKILHLGCGPIIIRSKTAEWINVDIESSHNPDITMDYLKMSEVFPKNSIDVITATHSIEHLPWPNGVFTFFLQAKQVLKPNGLMRILVPDLMKVAKKYVAGEDLKDIYDGPYYEGIDCPAERFKAFCRLWDHTVLFDYRLLETISVRSGFWDCKQMPFHESQIPELCDKDRFETESLCFECRS